MENANPNRSSGEDEIGLWDLDQQQDKKGFLFWRLVDFKYCFRDVENRTTPTFGHRNPSLRRLPCAFMSGHEMAVYVCIYIQLDRIPMTAVYSVAVQQYPPAMDKAV